MIKEKDLGVVACFYNPCKYEQKYLNLYKFIDNILPTVPNVLIVELLYKDEQTCLPSYVNSIQVYSDDVLWHKENLLNIGIKRLLNEGYKNIAWLDADIVFHNRCWQEETVVCLKENKLCQLFSSVLTLYNHLDSKLNYGCVQHWLDSGSILPSNGSYHTGLGWAARSEVLSECNLYQNSIVGGGDSLLWLSSCPKRQNLYRMMLNHPISILNINGYLIDFFNWAEQWNKIIDGSVSNIQGTVESLPHGSKKNRTYISRYEMLKRHEYIPSKNIYYKNNVIHCSNPKLNTEIVKYFQSRNEDDLNFFTKIYNKILNKNKLNELIQIEKKLV